MAENELKVNRERGRDMAKQNWKPGNMLYPVPAVMVSCQRPGEKPNIVTIAWAGTICSDPAMVSISVSHKEYTCDRTVGKL